MLNRPDPPRRRWPVAFLHYLVSELFLSRVFPAGVFGAALFTRVQDFAQRLQANTDYASPLAISTILQRGLTIVFVAILVILFLIRRPVAGRRSPFLGAVIALAATFFPAIPANAPILEDDITLMIMSSVLILVGTSLSIASLVVLGRCFGVLPEARGLVTTGPYALVRHPLYLSEGVSVLGLVVATASPTIGCLFVLYCGLQYWRALGEERALRSIFPEYEAYSRRTARFLPGIR